MILITGGAWQGKLDFALALAKEKGKDRNKVAKGTSDPFDAALDSTIIHGFHEYIRRILEEGKSVDSFIDSIAEKNPDVIIISNELGCGIVPMDPKDRQWREASGRASGRIAGISEEVYRLVCGIASRIK
ncbi:MAG: bifunctional adenosylcobinamide kinase/adenosylcobinamide-phosphate guanylyltransferase [Lacrimispora sp.]|uniref:bifunctional adenosylcobinamide kinase/adenosylcobinamide-phosphate guanylyltransferase n=1 Tax=Lacrimispora sp. TaxID=2719234 RepID=UPI0039E2A3E0